MKPEQKQRIIGHFIEEAREHLEAIDAGLASLSLGTIETEVINELFRAAHSIKGGAAMLGFRVVQQIAYRLEDYFKVLQEHSGLQVNDRLSDSFRRLQEALGEAVDHIEEFSLVQDRFSSDLTAKVEPLFEHTEQLFSDWTREKGASKLQISVSHDLAFSEQVRSKIEDMEQVFKREDVHATRLRLQGICDDLLLLGDRPEMSGWSDLVGAAKVAITNLGNSYRTLAPLVIKAIKSAQDLAENERFAEIRIPIEMRSLLPANYKISAVPDPVIATQQDTIKNITDSAFVSLSEDSQDLELPDIEPLDLYPDASATSTEELESFFAEANKMELMETTGKDSDNQAEFWHSLNLAESESNLQSEASDRLSVESNLRQSVEAQEFDDFFAVDEAELGESQTLEDIVLEYSSDNLLDNPLDNLIVADFFATALSIEDEIEDENEENKENQIENLADFTFQEIEAESEVAIAQVDESKDNSEENIVDFFAIDEPIAVGIEEQGEVLPETYGEILNSDSDYGSTFEADEQLSAQVEETNILDFFSSENSVLADSFIDEETNEASDVSDLADTSNSEALIEREDIAEFANEGIDRRVEQLEMPAENITDAIAKAEEDEQVEEGFVNFLITDDLVLTDFVLLDEAGQSEELIFPNEELDEQILSDFFAAEIVNDSQELATQSEEAFEAEIVNFFVDDDGDRELGEDLTDFFEVDREELINSPETIKIQQVLGDNTVDFFATEDELDSDDLTGFFGAADEMADEANESFLITELNDTQEMDVNAREFLILADEVEVPIESEYEDLGLADFFVEDMEEEIQNSEAIEDLDLENALENIADESSSDDLPDDLNLIDFFSGGETSLPVVDLSDDRGESEEPEEYIVDFSRSEQLSEQLVEADGDVLDFLASEDMDEGLEAQNDNYENVVTFEIEPVDINEVSKNLLLNNIFDEDDEESNDEESNRANELEDEIESEFEEQDDSIVADFFSGIETSLTDYQSPELAEELEFSLVALAEPALTEDEESEASTPTEFFVNVESERDDSQELSQELISAFVPVNELEAAELEDTEPENIELGEISEKVDGELGLVDLFGDDSSSESISGELLVKLPVELPEEQEWASLLENVEEDIEVQAEIADESNNQEFEQGEPFASLEDEDYEIAEIFGSQILDIDIQDIDIQDIERDSDELRSEISGFSGSLENDDFVLSDFFGEADSIENSQESLEDLDLDLDLGGILPDGLDILESEEMPDNISEEIGSDRDVQSDITADNLNFASFFNSLESDEDLPDLFAESEEALTAEQTLTPLIYNGQNGEQDDEQIDNLFDFEPSESSTLDNLAVFFQADRQVAQMDEVTEDSNHSEFDDLEFLLNDSSDSSSQDLVFDSLDSLLDPSIVSLADFLPAGTANDDFAELEALLGGSSELDTFDPKPRRSTERSRGKDRVISSTMKVDVKNLDSLNNLVGELVVNRNLLESDNEKLQQFISNLLYQVQLLSDVSQRMRDHYDRSLLENSIAISRPRTFSNAVGMTNFSEFGSDSGTAIKEGFDELELDRYSNFHVLSQEIIELIVKVRESSSDIEFVVSEAEQVSRQLGTITTQIQEDLKQVRMLPFTQISERLPRGVRDRSLQAGKKTDIVVHGGDTLIDKAILEQLQDPMVHLINNAIDHGIEDPLTRYQADKDETGVITVRAYHQGNQTVIAVSDDGAGIDPEKVKQSAIRKGLRTSNEVKSLSNDEVYDLIFEPGFSTAAQADIFKGRGVGMDVVKSGLEDMRGSIHTESAVGRGTTFTIRLPLTLSVSKAMFCISDRNRIAFPVDGFEDVVEISGADVEFNIKGQPCLPWRDTILPFRPLSDLLSYNRQMTRSSMYNKQEDDVLSVIILRNEGNYLALQVDQFLGENEIVIKNLEGPVPKPPGIAGATILGDGKVMAIANVLELFDVASGRLRVSQQKMASGFLIEDEAKQEPLVLIVDDSVTVRELLSLTFSKIGYRVEQAKDGQDAWEKLRSGLPCDLIFCDVEMPRMDGFELLSRIQKDNTLNKIPISMLTSRSNDRHRQTAAQLGASGYFTKPYLEEEILTASQRLVKGEKLIG
jgi:chemotaxis protein histidine kinase CheA/CheY-like chemotaxis protein